MGAAEDQRQGQQAEDRPVDGVAAHHQGQGILQGAAPQGGKPEQDVQPRQQGGFVPAEVKDQQNIKTDLMKGPLGGATAVYFSFIYNGKKTKVHTFLSNQAYNLKSKEIMEGISKADMYVNLLNGLKAEAVNA